MRIISGKFRGRQLKTLSGSMTRPTADRVKESVFNILGPAFAGGDVLDLYAGSGALGLEALSRGADRAHFVEKHPHAVEVVKANIALCGVEDRSQVTRDDAHRAVARIGKARGSFRYVFLDPPYRDTSVGLLLSSLAEHGLVDADSVIVVEHRFATAPPELAGALTRFRLERYGDTGVSFYRTE